MDSAEPKWPSSSLVVLATTAVLTFASLVALFPAALAPKLGPALGVSAAMVGFQVSLVYGGAMVTSLVGGSLIRRVGACRASQILLVLLGLGVALAAIPTVGTFAIASLLIGFAYGMTNPAAAILLVRFTPSPRHGLIFSIKQTGVPLGGVLAGVCAPALALVVGWQGALLLLAGMALLGAVMLRAKRSHWDQERDPNAPWMASPLAGISLVWQQRSLRYLSLFAMCSSCVQLSLSAFTVTLLVTDVKLGLVQAGFIMAAVQVAGVSGRVFWGWFADFIGSGRAALLVVTCLTIAGALATSQMTPAWPLGLTVGVLCLFGTVALGWNGVYLSEVARLAPPGHVAQASGGSLFFTFGGVLLGLPAVTGLHALLGSYTMAFAVLAAIAAIALVLVPLVYRAVERPPAVSRSGA